MLSFALNLAAPYETNVDRLYAEFPFSGKSGDQRVFDGSSGSKH
jgi:hypothetical protein